MSQKQHTSLVANLTFISIILATTLSAAPDAGAITQDIQKQLDKKAPKPSAKPDSKKSPAESTKAVGAKILVTAIRLSGNTLISTEELQAVLKPFIGLKLSFDQLQDVPRAIAEYYRQKGYQARAFLPPQEVVDGTIEVMILEGKLSAIEIDTEASKRLSKDRAINTIESAHPTGGILDMRKLERGLLILGDTPGITTASSLEAGENAGDSKLKIKMQDGSLIDGMVSLSNAGPKSTGTSQLSVSSSINSPASIGDQMTIQGMASKGVRYAKLGYVVPVTYGGLRMGANISKMSYKVVDGVDADGSSQSVGITATYPLIRSSMQSITLGSSLDRKIYNNTQALGSTDNKKVDVAAITLSGSKFDSYGQTQLGITLNGGKAYLDNQTVAKTYGGYTKLALNATRYQSVDETTSLSLSAQLQASNKNLDSSEKLYLGGSSGVRAYPSNEAGGDMGTLISAEATKSLPYGMSATLFYDYGYIVANKDNSQIKAHPNEYALGGAGASLAYAKGNFSAKATLAYRVGTNPNAQADGSDNDGTKKIPTVWFQINKGF